MKNHLSGLFRCPRLFVLFFGFTSFLATAQVGINTTSPEAMLDVVSSNSGLLIPRVALTSTTVAAPVVGPTVSEMVFNTSTAGDVTPGFYYWDGKWVRFSGEGGAVDPGNSWQLEGNAGTVPGTGNGENFLGTTDAKDLHIATNKNTRLIVKSDAHQVQAAGKGTAGRPFYSFKDGDGKAGMYLMGNNNNLLSFSTDGSERFRIGNKSGTAPQETIRSMLTHVFEPGTEQVPGITFRTNLKLGMFVPSGNRTLAFTTPPAVGSGDGEERMRITEAGVGINVTNPTEKLHVDGNIRFEGALMPGNAAGNSGQVLLSRGNDTEPEWGADLDGIQKIYQAVTNPPMNINYGDYGVVTVGPIDPSILTRDATVVVSIKSSVVGSDAPYNINIHSVLVNDTYIEIGYDNWFDFMEIPTSFEDVVFNITIIR